MKKIKRQLYHKINNEIEQEIISLIDNGYEQAALGTLGSGNVPFLSKALPFVFNKGLYLLLSDLSEHTKNVKLNPSVSLYFADIESHRSRSNNRRLTLQGKLVKLDLSKSSVDFLSLLDKYKLVDFGSEIWANFTDFNFYRFETSRELYVQGFGKAYERVL